MKIRRPPDAEPTIPATTLTAKNSETRGGNGALTTSFEKDEKPAVCATTPPKPTTTAVLIRGMIASCAPRLRIVETVGQTRRCSAMVTNVPRKSAVLGQRMCCELAKPTTCESQPPEATSTSFKPTRPLGNRINPITVTSGKESKSWSFAFP